MLSILAGHSTLIVRCHVDRWRGCSLEQLKLIIKNLTDMRMYEQIELKEGTLWRRDNVLSTMRLLIRTDASSDHSFSAMCLSIYTYPSLAAKWFAILEIDVGVAFKWCESIYGIDRSKVLNVAHFIIPGNDTAMSNEKVNTRMLAFC